MKLYDLKLSIDGGVVTVEGENRNENPEQAFAIIQALSIELIKIIDNMSGSHLVEQLMLARNVLKPLSDSDTLLDILVIAFEDYLEKQHETI
jgi:hypothetical protein